MLPFFCYHQYAYNPRFMFCISKSLHSTLMGMVKQGAGQNIPGQNIPCHFLTPQTKHPKKIYGKSMRDVLSGASKNGMGCFVPGCFVLHSVKQHEQNEYFTSCRADQICRLLSQGLIRVWLASYISYFNLTIEKASNRMPEVTIK